MNDLGPPEPFPWNQYEKICSLITKEVGALKEELKELRKDMKEEIKKVNEEIKDVRRDLSSMDDCWDKRTVKIEEEIDDDILDSTKTHIALENRIKELEKTIKFIKKVIYGMVGVLSSGMLIIFAEWVSTWFH